MKIDHVCFYVNDATATRDWFVQQLGFRSVGGHVSADRAIEVVNAGAIYFVLCSAINERSSIATFLHRHPPGVADIAFCVEDIEATTAQATQQGATVLRPIQTEVQAQGTLKWATLAAWGNLTHTLLERTGATSLLPQATATLDILIAQSDYRSDSPPRPVELDDDSNPGLFTRIDHVVLNVAAGDLERSVAWYERVLGFQPQQGFAIQTTHSALCSQVMRHPSPDGAQLPINEPASPNSQIQEFLDVNHGSGVQHIALETTDLVRAIAQLRQRHLSLIHVPTSYYAQLRQRSGFALSEVTVQQLEQQQILADWQPDTDQAVLLQTFTQPIFDEPTFFFELIQRQPSRDSEHSEQAQGFGEGNFRALFEAIEREQMKRGQPAPLLAQKAAHQPQNEECHYADKNIWIRNQASDLSRQETAEQPAH